MIWIFTVLSIFLIASIVGNVILVSGGLNASARLVMLGTALEDRDMFILSMRAQIDTLSEPFE